MEFLPDFGNAIYSVVAFVVALSIIVTVHEYGHYIIGRLSGIKAEVFSVGFGPRLFSRVDRHGTRWQVSALPLGGYVKFLGDANAASAGVDQAAVSGLSEGERRHTMAGAPLWARAATVAAGPVFNFILSILVFAGVMMWSGRATEEPVIGSLYPLPEAVDMLRPGDRVLAIGGIDTPDYGALYAAASDGLPDTPTVIWRLSRDGATVEVAGPQPMPPRLSAVIPASAAYAAGLQKGDVITEIDGVPAARFADLRQATADGAGKPLTLTVWRPDGADAALRTVTLTPKSTDMPTADGGFETRYMIGATGELAFAPLTRRTGLIEGITGGAQQTWMVVSSSVSGLKHMILGQISSCNLRGAIGIAEGSAAAAKSGLADFIWFIAVLSTAVGFLNLFPIPVLDGGHLVFHLYEAITGKPPSDGAMNGLMAIGMALVLALMFFGLWNDVTCP
ncbi:RIP metalloprotease RseP [Paenirhodobacter populi]|uniref:Zinc metalloprotease n=1 Tax=Paenirhodobacter populi TaxID=2306993 RepID=A0A443JTY4_9RHOB|nr:RIP metalloprotease RseP [Sinirhodobacter populi]RWR23974.1 RIP metalloprotease RseP [Sinirhodobacter populi]